jgi:hypothetical protein
MDATIKLKAYGIEAQNYMGVIGDTAASMGKSMDDTVEALADAQTGEFERLKEFGIKAVEVTKKNYQQLGVEMSAIGQTALTYVDKNGKQMAEVVDRNNREMITSTITAIWNDKYAGAMETRSKTLSGMWSTLKDNLSMGLADIMGYDMKNIEVQTFSLMGVFQSLMGVAVDLTGALSDIPEPIQTLIVVAALGVAGIGVLSAGFLAYGAILPLITADTAVFGVTLSAAIWPATAVVGALALVAAGLVYLDEKTGLVTNTWQLFSDMVTIVWNGLKGTVSGAIEEIISELDALAIMMSGGVFGGFGDAVTSILDPLGVVSTAFSNFTKNVHDVAEDIRAENKNIQDTTGETADAVDIASSYAGNAYGNWGEYAWGMADEVTSANDAAVQSTQTAATDYQKAVEDLMKDVQSTASAGVSFMSGVDIDDLRRGIRTVTDELIILNDQNELVKVSADGTVTSLEGMGAVTFDTARGAITIFTDGITDAQVESGTLEKLINDMGNDVVVLDGTKLDNLNGQISGTQTTIDNTRSSTITWQDALNQTHNFDFSGLQGNIAGVGTEVDTTTGKTDNMNNTFVNTNGSPFGTLQDNLSTVGVNVDEDTGKTDSLNSALGTTNLSPFGTLFGNLSTEGSLTDTNTGKTDSLNSTLRTTNLSPFGTLFGNLMNGGVKVDTLKGKTDDTNSSMGTLGGFSFSTTISNLGGITTKIGNIIEDAKDAISWLSKLGSSSSSSSSGSSSSGGSRSSESGVTKTGGSGTGEGNVKIVTYNNYSSSVLKNSIQKVS